DFNNYELKYTAELVDGTTLEDIYTRFNVEHPDDFTGHSLSVSDVIVVHDDDVTTAYYIDDVGYKKVPEFLQLEQKEDIVEDFQNKNTATTDTPDYSQAIHEGFTALYSSHTYTEKQNKFLKRLENYAANNNVTENIVNTAFEKGAAFRNTYGNKEYISRNLFARRLGSLEKELESNIRAVINPQELEEKIHQVITNAGYDGGVDEKKEYTSFKEALEVGQKYIEDGYLGFAIYNQNTQMIERVEGDFPVTTAFSDEILKINGIDNRKVEVNTVINGNNLENTDALATAKQLINEFCEDEYEISADFSDMHNVALAHTTLTDEQVPVQVTADLLDYKLIYEFGYEVFKTEEFSSIEDMVQNGLTGLDFADLVDVPDELIEKYVPNIKDYYNQYAILSRCKQDCIYAINRAEHIDSIKSLNKYLYLGSVDSCINTMREHYDKLPDTDKPEWLSLEDINDYERQLNDIIAQIHEKEAKMNRETRQVAYDEAVAVYREANGLDDYDNVSDEPDYSDEYITQEAELDREMRQVAYDEAVAVYREANGLDDYVDYSNDYNEITEASVDTNINDETETVDTSSNDIEQLTDEANATTLADVEVGDILLLKEPESGELMYFRIDSFQDNFMVSMSRVADAAGNDFTEIGKASIGIIDGHWRETLLDNNTDSPILRYTKNYQEELKQQQNNVATNSNEAPVEERVHKRASRAEMLYREFTEAYPDIANGTHTYERYGEDYNEYGENDAFEPLSLEYLGDDTYSFMTWYVQNGDLMHDPDFVFTLDHENKELHVWEFQMDGVPAFGTLYERVEQEDGSIDRKLQASLEDNFRTNLRNAIAVKRELTAYTDINGEEHELKQNEVQVKPETPEINDSSAYYREA
ncbi:MAG: hypothetical protein IJJ57_05845, partial [Ruminococcus sp.]|nr:hypothetical protein [Ruminococcus sp.]